MERRSDSVQYPFTSIPLFRCGQAEATLRNLYAEAVAREREAQIEAAEEETKVLEEVEGMMQEVRRCQIRRTFSIIMYPFRT